MGRGLSMAMLVLVAMTASGLLSPATVRAQQSTPATCPIQITQIDQPQGFKAKTLAGLTTDGPHVGVESAVIAYRNNSSKIITAVRFESRYLNPMGEYSISINQDTPKLKLKPGKAGRLLIQLPRSNPDSTVDAWVQKIAFSDGSYWQDDGSRSCTGPNPTPAGKTP